MVEQRASPGERCLRVLLPEKLLTAPVSSGLPGADEGGRERVGKEGEDAAGGDSGGKEGEARMQRGRRESGGERREGKRQRREGRRREDAVGKEGRGREEEGGGKGSRLPRPTCQSLSPSSSVSSSHSLCYQGH